MQMATLLQTSYNLCWQQNPSFWETLGRRIERTQLSHSDDDPEGWTASEVEGYDGWCHESKRTFRQGERLRREGFDAFQSTFGPEAFALQHR